MKGEAIRQQYFIDDNADDYFDEKVFEDCKKSDDFLDFEEDDDFYDCEVYDPYDDEDFFGDETEEDFQDPTYPSFELGKKEPEVLATNPMFELASKAAKIGEVLEQSLVGQDEAINKFEKSYFNILKNQLCGYSAGNKN